MRNFPIFAMCLLGAACTTVETPERSFRSEADEVAPGLPYDVYAELEATRLHQLGERASAALEAGLAAELGMDPGDVAAGNFNGDDLDALQEIVAATPWEAGTFTEWFPWAEGDWESPTQYWSNAGYEDFGQQTYALSASCQDVVGEHGLAQVTPLDWSLTAGSTTHGLLPVNLLGGASVVVACRSLSPSGGWSTPITNLGLPGIWPSLAHSSGGVFTPYAQPGVSIQGNVVSSSTQTRAKNASIFLDATNVSGATDYSLICDAVSFTHIDGQGQIQGAKTYCIDIEVEPDEPPEPELDCSGLPPVTMTPRTPNRPLWPGESVSLFADWSIASGAYPAACLPLQSGGEIGVSSSPAGALAYGGSIGRYNGGTPAPTTSNKVPMERFGESMHNFTVDANTTVDEATVRLTLRDNDGLVTSKTIDLDIVQGPEFGTTWSSSCPGYDYCWRFFNEYAPGRSGPPSPGQVLTGSFPVNNFGTADLSVTATPPTGMYAMTSPTAVTVPAQYNGGGHWFNSTTLDFAFTTPAEADLPSLCRRDGTDWYCEQDLVLATNDNDPAQQTVTVQLQTRFAARDVLTVLDDQGAEIPEVLDLGVVTLGDTVPIADPNNPQLEACPAGHMYRQLNVHNDGVMSSTYSRLLPSDVNNTAGAFLLNGPRSQWLAPNDTMLLELCILPKETGVYEERLEIWQSTFPHDSMDVTLRYEAIEPVEVRWANTPFVDGDTIGFGMLASGSPAPLDLGPAVITNHTNADISVTCYPSVGYQTWDATGLADADGAPFNSSHFMLLHPGESMSYGIDLLDTSAGDKTGELRVSWGTPTSINGRRVTGFQPVDQIDIDLAVHMY